MNTTTTWIMNFSIKVNKKNHRKIDESEYFARYIFSRQEKIMLVWTWVYMKKTFIEKIPSVK